MTEGSGGRPPDRHLDRRGAATERRDLGSREQEISPFRFLQNLQSKRRGSDSEPTVEMTEGAIANLQSHDEGSDSEPTVEMTR